MALHPLERAYQERVPASLRNRWVARRLAIPQTLALLAAVERERCFTTLRRQLAIELRAEHTEHIPRDGPLVVFANHPFPMVDLTSVATVLEHARPDSPVRVVVDPTSDPLVELHPLMLFVGTDEAGRQAFWEQALGHLEAGGTVLIFPSGRSVFRARDGRAVEPRWRAGGLKLAARSGAPLLPVHVKAQTGTVYNWLRRHGDRKKVAALNLNQAFRRHKKVRVRFGAPLQPEGRTPEELRRIVYALDPDASFVEE